MKTIQLIVLLLFSIVSNAQFLDKLAKKAEEATKRTVERKVEQKAEKTTDKTIDKVLNPEKKGKSESSSSEEKSKKGKKSKSANTAKDFIPGNKILATENFSQDAVGDFPVNWSTNSSGEIITFDDSDTKWLKLNDNGNYTPNHITKLPENFTFELDVYASDNFSFYSTWLNIAFVEAKKKTDYNKWGEFKKGKEGVIVSLHPQLAGSEAIGGSGYSIITDGGQLMNNNAETTAFNRNQNTAKVQFWRQKKQAKNVREWQQSLGFTERLSRRNIQ